MKKQDPAQTSSNAKLMSAALTELITSRWTAGLSTRDNPMMLESISSALGFFQRLFALNKSYTLNISRGNLFFENTNISLNNPFLQDFSGALENRGVSSVKFSEGLTIEEFLEFQTLFITGDTSSGNAAPEKEVLEKMPHIDFRFGETENAPSDALTPELPGETTPKWNDYISAILSGSLSEFDAEIIIANIPPEEMSSYLNAHVPDNIPQDSPQKIVSIYVGSSGAQGIRPDLFEKFIVLINGLDPQLKREFLLQTISSTKLAKEETESLFASLTASELDTFLASFSELTETAKKNIEYIIEIMNTIQSPNGLYHTMGDGRSVLPGCDILTGNDSLPLFTNEKFDKFLTEEYWKPVIATFQDPGQAARQQLHDLLRTLNREKDEKRFSEICLELLADRTVIRDDYLMILSRIAGLATLFLESGRFNDFVETYNTVYSDTLSGTFRDDASSMMNYFFRSPEYLQKAVEAVKVWGSFDPYPTVKFVEAQRLYLLGPLFDALADEQDAAVRNYLLELFGRISFDVLDEAVKRLDDDRWYVLRNMLYVIRKMEGSRHSSVCRKFVNHIHPKVAVEALESLLHFRDPDAVMLLKKMILDPNTEKRDEAVRLAGEYKIRAVLPALTALLEKVEYISSGPNYKVLVVRAMHEIGAPEAVPAFTKLLSSSAVLNVGALEELKLEIYKALDRYPIEAVRGLIAMGGKSPNAEIKAISNELMKKDWMR